MQFSSIAHNGRGYKIVAEYEAKTYRTAQSYIRATALQVCTTTDMFYSLCYMPPFFGKIFFENVCKFKTNVYICKRNQILKQWNAKQ